MSKNAQFSRLIDYRNHLKNMSLMLFLHGDVLKTPSISKLEV